MLPPLQRNNSVTKKLQKMNTVETPVKNASGNGASIESKKTTGSHITAAKHHEEAAKHLHEAAKHHEAGNADKAAASTLKANGHLCIANDHHEEIAKVHATATK